MRYVGGAGDVLLILYRCYITEVMQTTDYRDGAVDALQRKFS